MAGEVTEAQLQRARREGWTRALNEAYNLGFINSSVLHTLDKRRDRIFPLPKVERPRAVVDPHDPQYRWSVRDGRLMEQYVDTKEPGVWYDTDYGDREPFVPTPARVALWADLFANPTELVDAA